MVKKTRIQLPNWTILLVLLSGLSGCGDGTKHKVDLTGHEVEVTINRLEGDLFSVTSTADYVALNEVDTSLMKAYKSGIMGPETRDGFIPVEQSAERFIQFITNADMRHLYRSVDSTYQDISDIEEGLSNGFSHYNYYFPEKTVPKVYSVVTPFRAQNITTDNAIAICLDMYLGPKFFPYQSPQLEFPNFLINRFKREYIVPNAMKGWVESDYERDPRDNRLLAEMIYQGKILYALDRLLPETADSLKIGYKEGQIEWCKENEFQIWTHLVESDLLYNTEHRTYSGVLADGPFSKGNNVPPQAPARIAVWAGWQIVREYMDKNTAVSLSELLEDTDADKILQKSGYKP